MTYSPKSILVTGAAGFIGSHFVDFCLSHDVKKIVSLDLLTYAGNLENLAFANQDPRHHFVHDNINNQKKVMDLIRDYQVDTIVHFAAESHVDRSIASPEDFMTTNVMGTFHLLEAAQSVWPHLFSDMNKECRFHHISTDEVYGSLKKEDMAFTEMSRYEPSSPYSASKASSDHLVRAWFHTYKLPTIITNCSNNYGPRQANEKFIPTVIHALMHKKSIPIYGDGSNIRDWLYVEDHCEGIWVALTKGTPGESYNIGGDTEMSNLDLSFLLCAYFDEHFSSTQSHQQFIKFVADRAGHDWRYAINHDKLSDISWQPKMKITEGLQKTIEYYLECEGAL